MISRGRVIEIWWILIINVITPGDFLSMQLHEKKERLESAELRQAILNGYQDAIAGHVYVFSGDLRKDMKVFQEKDQD